MALIAIRPGLVRDTANVKGEGKKAVVVEERRGVCEAGGRSYLGDAWTPEL
jgi:hypothetical protein